MDIVNLTRGLRVARDIKVARTQREKLFGLLREKKPRALLLGTRWGIHTVGMRYPIDVAVLNKDHEVAHLFLDVVPGEVVLWNPRHWRVVELPKGTVRATETRVGDQFIFV